MFRDKVINTSVYCIIVQMRIPLVFKRQESDFLDLNSSFEINLQCDSANHLTSLGLSFLYLEHGNNRVVMMIK